MKLKIHSWGGLGSQLHVLSITHDIKQKFPTRKLTIIHHTSGVSRRLFELNSILGEGIELKVVDDFKEISNSQIINVQRYKKFVVRIIKIAMKALLITLDLDQNDLNQIKPWTFEVRGHYSKKEISNEFLINSVKLFSTKEVNDEVLPGTLVIHYRLGDLLVLTEKSIVDSGLIIDEVKKVSNFYKLQRAVVYSDSVEVAKQKLSKLGDLFDHITFSNAPTIEVIKNSVHASFFIGTNSKVSFWIERFRKSIEKPYSIIANN